MTMMTRIATSATIMEEPESESAIEKWGKDTYVDVAFTRF